MLRCKTMMVALFQLVRAENLPGGQDPFVVFFRETSPTAKVVLGILLLFSLISWIIIFAKYIRLARISRQSEKFVLFFRKSKRCSEGNKNAGKRTETPVTPLIKAEYAELDAQIKAVRNEETPVTTIAMQ